MKHLSVFSNEGMWGNGVTNPLTLLNLGITGTPRIFLAEGGRGGLTDPETIYKLCLILKTIL